VILCVVVGAASSLAVFSPRAFAAVGTITEFPIPTLSSSTIAIQAGPDGNLWFIESSANKIGRITTKGVITEFPLASGSAPEEIASGPDGNLWFTEDGTNKIGMITPAGAISEFNVPTASAGLTGIAAGSDGNLWFTEESNRAEKIGRITTAGAITEFPLPTTSLQPIFIAAGPDGNLWFTEEGASTNKIARITTAGVVTEFPVPTSNAAVGGIAAGPDGGVWFTEDIGGKVGRIDPSTDVITEFSVPATSPLSRIAAGQDGNLWFTEGGPLSNVVDRITPTGTLTTFNVPTSNAIVSGVAPGVDGNIWFTEQAGNKIGRLTDAAPNTSYALVRSFSFTPVTAKLAKQGTTLQWSFYGPVSHTATDSTGMGLFDSGVHSFVTYFSFAFTAAGSYAFHCTIHPTLMNGTVSVPISVPKTGTVGTPFTVTWASAGPPSGFVFDAQVKTPGSTTWTTWQTAVTTLSADYTPAVAGTYQFRARLRNAANGKASAYSPPGKVVVT
jgi:streptogramin lyase